MKKFFVEMQAIVFILFFSLTPLLLYAQLEETNPCDAVATDIAPFKFATQSSTQFNQVASFAVDGITSDNQLFASTQIELNPWWEVDLQSIYNLKGVNILRDEAQSLSDYYILVSETAFPSNDLNSLLLLDQISSYHVASNYPSEYFYAFGEGINGRYVRIQKNGIGNLSLREIGIPGRNVENCGNGIDDDCDGLIDCDDLDCRPTIINAHIIRHPSCQICQDGSIGVQASSKKMADLRISIDGGNTFIWPKSSYTVFNNLGPGDYHIVAKNDVSGCQTEWHLNPLQLRPPTGTPNNCCNNGDFENGNFDGWTGGVGKNNKDEQPPVFNNETIDTKDDPGGYDDISHNLIGNTSGYIDQQVPNLPVINGGTGTYLVRLGDSDIYSKTARLTYCFTVDECNKNFLFNYMVVLQDPQEEHTQDEKPYFQFILRDNTLNQEVKKVKKISDANDPFFNRLVAVL